MSHSFIFCMVSNNKQSLREYICDFRLTEEGIPVCLSNALHLSLDYFLPLSQEAVRFKRPVLEDSIPNWVTTSFSSVSLLKHYSFLPALRCLYLPRPHTGPTGTLLDPAEEGAESGLGIPREKAEKFPECRPFYWTAYAL